MGPTLTRFLPREALVLGLLCAVGVSGFFLTRAAAAANRESRLRDAADWYEAGRVAAADGRDADAVEALRRATAIDRDNTHYRLALAEALAVRGEGDAARNVLLAIRQLRPEDTRINLHLARLEARRDQPAAAVRYYQNALYGVWEGDEPEDRRRIRVELVRYLLDRGEQAAALAELLALTSTLPVEIDSWIEAARLLAEAGDPSRARELFERALAADRRNGVALAGAGEAAFDLGDYEAARRYLQRAPVEIGRVAELRPIADLVLTRDPLASRLALADRRRRLRRNLTDAVGRLEACQPAAAPQAAARADELLAEATAFEPSLETRALQRSPEAVEAGVLLVSRMTRQAVDVCGEPTPLDRALVLIGRRHGVDQP